MAITSARMQMRRGNEIDFDPDKMHPGEWAVSTDKKIVRMCIYPGLCLRMATYEAFEEDMEQIIAILEEANTVKEAIEEIYKEFQEAELDIEAAENAAILSESYAKGGTGTREDEDTDNAKYYAEQAKISADNAASVASVEIMTTEKAGIGKPDGKTITADEDGTMRVPSHSDVALNRQTLGYTKKNIMLPKFVSLNKTVSGVTFTDNGDGSIHVKGTSTALINFAFVGNSAKKIDFVSAGTKLTFSNTSDKCGVMFSPVASGTTLSTGFTVFNGEKTMTLNNDSDTTDWYIAIFMYSGVTIDETIYPMIRSAYIEDDTFEPYVDDVDTRLKALTPVNNLLATVPGSPLDAVMGKELNNRVLTLEDAFMIYTVSLINGWVGTLAVSVNKINRQVSITGFIDGTNATDTIFAKANIEDNGVPVPVNAISLIVQQGYNNAFVTIGFSNSGNGWEAKAPSISHVYKFSTGYIMSN